MMESKNVLIACTGSVATIKMGEIVQRLQNQTNYKFQVKIGRIKMLGNSLEY